MSTEAGRQVNYRITIRGHVIRLQMAHSFRTMVRVYRCADVYSV